MRHGCGASLLADQAGVTTGELLKLLQREITSTLTLQIAGKALHQDTEIAKGWSPETELFLRRLLRLSDRAGGMSATVNLERPVVAVGAPVQAYFPEAAAALGARLVIPEHSEVANAFGAVTGRVMEKCEVRVRPERPDGFTVAAAGVQRRLDALEQALQFAREYAADAARAGAECRGGEELAVTVEQQERSLPLQAGWGDRVLIEVLVSATAVGRPRSLQ